MDDLVRQSFERTLVKLAGPGSVFRAAADIFGRQAGAVGAGAGLGAAGGAVLGLGSGAVQGYRQAREQGASAGEAAFSGLSSGLGRAGKGALLGAGLGAGAGLAGGGRAAGLAKDLAGREGALGSMSRFGQRQLHGLTGALPPGMSTRDAMQSMRMGATGAIDRSSKAFTELKGAGPFAGSKEMIGDRTGDQIFQKAKSTWEGADKGKEYALKAERLGLTSIPGYMKSLAKNPGETVRTAVGAGWHGGSATDKLLTFGLPLATAASELASKPEEGGPGRAEKALRTAASMAAPVGVMPLAAQLGVGSLLRGGAGVVGSGIDAQGKRRQQLKALTGPAPDDANAPPVQREYSPAALGRPPEGVG